MLGGVSYDKVDDEGLHITVGGEARVLDVDHVVVCAGQEPLKDLEVFIFLFLFCFLSLSSRHRFFVVCLFHFSQPDVVSQPGSQMCCAGLLQRWTFIVQC